MANQPNPAVNDGRRFAWRGSESVSWLLLGLLVGLLIGWVIWPVQWTDAGLDDLSPAVRAQFISATADAYVASGGQEPATALARMHGFTNPQAAVAEAIVFYQQNGDPNRAIREVNLRSLASALGSLPITGRSPTPGLEIGWLDWILVAFAALLLLAGGLWLGRRLSLGRKTPLPVPSAQPTSASPPTAGNQPAWVLPQSFTPSPPAPAQSAPSAASWQPSAPNDQPVSAPPHPSESSPRVVIETWDSRDDAPIFAEPVFPPSGRSAPQAPTQPKQPQAETDEIQRIVPGVSRPTIFDPGTEDEEEAQQSEWQSWESTERSAPAAPATAKPDEDEDGGWEDDWDRDTTALEDDEFDDEFDDEVDELDDGRADDEWDAAAEEDDADITPAAPTPITPVAPVAPVAPATAARRTPPSPPKTVVSTADDDAGGFLPTVQGVLSSLLRGEKESNPPARGGKAISSFVADFHAGILAYEQSFTITSTGGEDGTPLGACGVGISEKLDKEAAHSDKVRVLDVWLYDGGDVRSWNQYLTSPGMDREALATQAKSSATITGEPLDIAPGLAFRITSKNLVLECRVVAAEFLPTTPAPSPLRSVRIEMTAKAAK